MHYVSCIRRYNALMNKVIWISGVTVSTRAKALVLTVTPLMHINLFISALYLRMHSTRALSYTTLSPLLTMNRSIEVLDAEVNIPYAIFLSLLVIIAVIMNTGTIVAFWKLPTLYENPSELLILNLACSDLLTGLIVLPLASPLYITPNRWPTGEIGCAIWVFFIDISVHGTLFALMTISLDRFLLVYLEYPQYIGKVTRRRIYKVIAVGWIFALLTAIVEMGLWEKAKSLDETAGSIDHTKYCLSPPRRVRTFSLCFFLILYLSPVLFVCGLSVAFLYQLRNRLRKLRKYKSSCTTSSSGGISASQTIEMSQSASSGNVNSDEVGSATLRKHVTDTVLRNRYIKPGVTLVGLVSLMGVCMLPYSFYVIIIESGCEHCSDPKLLYGLLLMQFCNACLDPFIYVLTRKRMRTFYRSCLWK